MKNLVVHVYPKNSEADSLYLIYSPYGVSIVDIILGAESFIAVKNKYPDSLLVDGYEVSKKQYKAFAKFYKEKIKNDNNNSSLSTPT